METIKLIIHYVLSGAALFAVALAALSILAWIVRLING